jgi:hypothetical protein
MVPARALFAVAFVLTAGCGGKILGETAPSDTDEPNDNPGAASQPAKFVDPFHPGESWIGNYTCAQGDTDLDFKIVAMHGDFIDDAIFVFDWESGGVTGSFHMSGSFDPTSGTATFTPGAWIDQPSSSGEAWFSVGMTGPASASTFSGSITNESCGAFSLTKS